MKKFFSVGALALALMMGMSSCDKNKDNTPDSEKNVDTYVGVSISFPAPSMRANLPGDFNKLGSWDGRDDIQTIKVYVVTDGATINATSFTKEAFNSINGGVLKPNLAVEAKAGQNVKAYVVINDVNGKVTAELDKLGAAEFATKFASTVASVTKVSDVAAFKGKNDVVVMTNEVAPKGVSVAAGISEEKAKTGPTNLLEVNVDRVVARGIVTVAEAATKTIEIKRYHTVVNNSTGTPVTKKEETVTATVTISDIKYQVTGSALQFNVLRKGDWTVPNPVYTFAPAADWSATATNANGIMTYTDEGSWQTAIVKAGNTLDNVKAALGEEKFSKFALPVTHASGNYKKGNTTMFEVKATFTVDKIDGAAPATSEAKTVFFGLSDGKFYSTKEKAEAMDATGVSTDKKQEVKEYTNGEMYYYIWLNPDVAYSDKSQLIKESPTVRNHIYNAHITGFGAMGVTSKDEIKPDEPLETEKTYLSVEIKVLPWTIHSYKVDLGNRY